MISGTNLLIMFSVAVAGMLLGLYVGSCIRASAVTADKQSRKHFKGKHSMMRKEENAEYKKHKAMDKQREKEEKTEQKKLKKELKKKTTEEETEEKPTEKKENRLKEHEEIESFVGFKCSSDDEESASSYVNGIKKTQDKKYGYIKSKYKEKAEKVSEN